MTALLDLYSVPIQLTFAFLFIFVRINSIFLTVPLFSSRVIPIQVKLWLSLFFSALFFPLIINKIPQIPILTEQVFLIVLKEIFIGLLIGFVAMLIFAIFEFAAFELDQIMGLRMSMSMNPLTNTRSSITSQLFYVITGYIFLIINGHHWLFIAIRNSYDILPIGHFNFTPMTLQFLVTLFQDIFTVGLEIALPIFAVLFIVNVILGVFARLVPQMNVFFLGFPVKISIGLFLVLFSLEAYFDIFPKIMGGLQIDFQLLINHLK